jgi:hypothetical protein
VALTDANGTTVQTYEYSVYGHVAACDPNHSDPFMFTCWRPGELGYRNQPRTLLDRLFLSSCSARGARNRLQVLQEEICTCIEQCGAIGNPVKLVSFGSGPAGRFEMLLPEKMMQVSWT